MKSITMILSASLLVLLSLTFPVPLNAFAVSPSSTSCVPAGSTGLNTLIVAHSGQTIIHKTIDAQGCDIGIYVPPGTSNVNIAHNTITDAAVHGIFAQDSTHVLISMNYVFGNSFGLSTLSCDLHPAPSPCVNEGKAIQLSGVSYSVVSHNTLTGDFFGGIAVTDDGAIDPGALYGGNAMGAYHNLVIGNNITDVANDCGIVIAVYNPETSSDNMVMNNLVVGSLPPFGVNPYVGQIVVATDGPDATITGTVVSGNTIVGSTLPGIVVHSNAPGDSISGTIIRQNYLGNNGYYPVFFSSPNTPVAADGPTGMSIVAEVNPAYPPTVAQPTITGTVVVHNVISPDTIGVWLCGTSGTLIQHTPDKGSDVTTAVTMCPSGGS